MKKRNVLYCFSPGVMLTTMLIEWGGALWTCWRYKLNAVGRLTTGLLACLGMFQAAEYMICTVEGLTGLTWAVVGHVAITLLPPMGISLAIAIAKKKKYGWQVLMYTVALGFIAYFVWGANAITGQVCLGNYVIFTSGRVGVPWWGLYYYVYLALIVYFGFSWAKEVKEVREAKALRWLAIACLCFVLPTTTVNVISPETIAGIPSIMCGFAVLLAVILLLRVLPLVGVKRRIK